MDKSSLFLPSQKYYTWQNLLLMDNTLCKNKGILLHKKTLKFKFSGSNQFLKSSWHIINSDHLGEIRPVLCLIGRILTIEGLFLTGF